jgi:hypothetical protein
MEFQTLSPGRRRRTRLRRGRSLPGSRLTGQRRGSPSVRCGDGGAGRSRAPRAARPAWFGGSVPHIASWAAGHRGPEVISSQHFLRQIHHDAAVRPAFVLGHRQHRPRDGCGQVSASFVQLPGHPLAQLRVRLLGHGSSVPGSWSRGISSISATRPCAAWSCSSSASTAAASPAVGPSTGSLAYTTMSCRR